jgi:hypothetical protein
MMLVLVLLVMPISTLSVLAYYGDIYLNPDKGEIGDRIDIAGEDFEESYYNSDTDFYFSYVDIYFSREEADEDDQINDEVENYERLRSNIFVDYDGEFSTYFYIPDELTDGADDKDVTGGTYYIYITYQSGVNIVAVADLTVITAEIRLEPNDGPVGTEVEISGIDFTRYEDISVKYDGDEISIKSGDDDTDLYGEFSCTIIIPESTAGEHTLTVIDDAGIEAGADFTVEPKITTDPNAAEPGDSVTVMGYGFGQYVDFVLRFDGYEVETDDTDQDGSFRISFMVPARSYGTVNIEAEDDDGNDAKVKFTIVAVVQLSQVESNVGDEIIIGGAGFQVGGSVTIVIDNQTVATTSVDGDGEFSISFKVPALNADSYQVIADDGLNQAIVELSVITDATINPVTSTSLPGRVGTELTVSGVGFSSGSQVTITYDGTEVISIMADTNGSFRTTFDAPVSKAGQHEIIVTDGIATRQLVFVMESTSPQIPTVLAPEVGTKAKAQAYFNWEDVVDPSLPVTYNLQIATNRGFTTQILEQVGLTESEYALAKEERLSSTGSDSPYYWRIQAVDSAGNQSSWTSPMSFYVGFSLDLPSWAQYTLLGVGGVLLLLVGFYVGRKTAYSF